MNKDRHILRNNWENLRADIESILKDKRLSTGVKALSIHDDWKAIEENICYTFCKLDNPTQRPIWLWEYFKLDTFSVVVGQPYRFLDQLLNSNEIVWFFVNDDKHKFWFYEGEIKSIKSLIEESSYIDELYIVSKKYQWLICINHHDSLIATGQIMPDKLRSLM